MRKRGIRLMPRATKAGPRRSRIAHAQRRRPASGVKDPLQFQEACMSNFFPVLASVALLGASSLTQAADIGVMTQNQYLGADLGPVLSAGNVEPFDPVVFNAALVEALQKVAAAQPAARVAALAADIAQRRPDVVGLQEAYVFACLPFPGMPQVPGMGCDDPSIRQAFTDQLANTEMALRGRYRTVAKVTNLAVSGIPFAINGFPAILNVADRDAILVRSGLPAQPVDFAALTGCRASDQGCNYVVRPPPLNLPTPSGPVTVAIERGYVAVDTTVRGKEYRVFNTHLEQRLLGPELPETRLLQVGQAYELYGTALGTWDGRRKLVVMGDFNSAPGDVIPVPPYPAYLAPGLPTKPPYDIFAGGGFADAWSLRAPPGDGLSCCQAEDLANRRSGLYERIDLIFTIPAPARVVDMKLIGATMGDKTRPPGHGGLWPSDHASVTARLFFD
jgi:hypothetical protein